MASLFDRLAQNGGGVDALARQFGLSQQQAQAAVEALMPAFSQGLKRNTADPYGLGAFMTAMASGQHAKYFENPAAAFSQAGVEEGNGILGHLFGSKDLSRAVAAQAAQASGVSQAVLQQMLPSLASMLMGGLSNQTNRQMQAAGGFGGGNNPLGEIIGEMMRQAGGQASTPQQPQAPQGGQPADNPFGKILQDMLGGAQGSQQPQASGTDNPLGKVLQDMFGGGAAQQQPRGQTQAQSPHGDNPLGQILDQIFGPGGLGGQAGMPGGEQPAPQRREAPEAEPQSNPSGRPRNPFDDLFGKMFETGAQQRDDYQRGMETIFDQFKRGMDRR